MLATITLDDATLNWIYGMVAVAVPTVGGTVVLLWRKFVAYITPKVTDAFNAHTGLVNEMKTQIPIVGETLKKLGETQEKQCETLDQHSEMHKETRKTLQEINDRLSSTHEAKQ